MVDSHFCILYLIIHLFHCFLSDTIVLKYVHSCNSEMVMTVSGSLTERLWVKKRTSYEVAPPIVLIVN